MQPLSPESDLPALAPAEQAHCERVAAEIRRRIEAAGGAIDFSAFMDAALYTPGLGYYASDGATFGEAGDFVTAPELGPVFARCLARQCKELFEQTGVQEILEAGAGSGALAAELLAEFEHLGAPHVRYRILELSGALRARQQKTLAARVPHLAAHVEWLDRWPGSIRGVVIANELLDALPVERFRVTGSSILQLQVGIGSDFGDGNDASAAGRRPPGMAAGRTKQDQPSGRPGRGFAWRERPADAIVSERVTPLGLPEGYISELGLQAEAWVGSLGARLEHGVALFIDYGFPRAEFYHPQRATGTLMCHFRHRAHTDPLIRVGLQDITAHVDFSAIGDASRAAGLHVLGYTSQAMFLLGCGLDEIVAASDASDAATHLRLTNEVNRLTSPAEMGELFKVLAVGRGVDGPLRGFSLNDRRSRL
ncbi:MAG: hypothetical protein AMJ72_00645 [Acidithiobacillales bacterium SM1_46]|nr:MAG: hypothetical protein AMJ72_00645 [Acidithiobacillales bacterium SM1_46]